MAAASGGCLVAACPLRRVNRYLVYLRHVIHLIVASKIVDVHHLPSKLRMRWHLLLIDLFGLRLRLLRLLEAHVVLRLPSTAAKLIRQAPLLLGRLGLLQDWHVLRVVEIDVGRLSIGVYGYWICIRELVALGAGVGGLDDFTGLMSLRAGRHHATVETIYVRARLSLLLMDGLGSAVASGC